MKILDLGESAKTRNKTYVLASEMVEKLADKTGEGVDFCIYEMKIIYAVYNKVISPNDSYFRRGKKFPVHVSSAGKSILSDYSKKRKERISLEKLICIP